METLYEPRVLPIGQVTAPCLCVDVEMSAEVPGIPAQPGPVGARCAWVLVSIHTEAVGSLILEVPPQGLTGEQVTRGILRELGGELEGRISSARGSS
jgi:hypothetical protein